MVSNKNDVCQDKVDADSHKRKDMARVQLEDGQWVRFDLNDHVMDHAPIDSSDNDFHD